MDVSLDTCAIINLYKLNLQNVMFGRFDNIYVYEFIRKTELAQHASDILEKFDADVKRKRINIITQKYLKSIHMYEIFKKHVKDNEILYNTDDKGEVYAIALALILGNIELLTDDIKLRGPHYTLIRQPYCDIKPFACYELFIFDYLESQITAEQLADRLKRLNSILSKPMNMQLKINNFNKRFFIKPVPNEKKWISGFCKEKSIDAKLKMQQLIEYITAAETV